MVLMNARYLVQYSYRDWQLAIPWNNFHWEIRQLMQDHARVLKNVRKSYRPSWLWN